MESIGIDVDVTIHDDLVSVEQTEKGTTLNLFVLDYIDGYGSTDPEVVISNIKAHNPDFINIYIGSGGGEVFVAAMISDALRGNRAIVTAYLTGICASAATHIACAADTVVMSRSCLYMVHSAAVWTGTSNIEELQAAVKQLEAVNATQIAIYTTKTGKTAEELAPLMQGDNWLTAAEALEWGFVDSVVDNIDMDLTLPGDVKQYYNCCGHDDYFWYAFVDPKTGSVRPENEVFTACIEQASTRRASAGIKPITKTTTVADAAPIKSENDMKLFEKIVAALVKQGIVPEAKSADAVANLNANSGDFTASIVEQVKADMDVAEQVVTDPALTDSAPAETKSLADQIAELSGDELKQIQDVFAPSTPEKEAANAEVETLKASLAAAEAKATEATNKVTALAEKISAQRAGRPGATTVAAAPPASNGDGDIGTDGDDKEVNDNPALAAIMAKAEAAGAFNKPKRA